MVMQFGTGGCPADMFHRCVNLAAQFEIAQLLIAGVEVGKINKDHVTANIQQTWLEFAVPAGTA